MYEPFSDLSASLAQPPITQIFSRFVGTQDSKPCLTASGFNSFQGRILCWITAEPTNRSTIVQCLAGSNTSNWSNIFLWVEINV